jgi:hypothetical protein
MKTHWTELRGTLTSLQRKVIAASPMYLLFIYPIRMS